MGVGVDLTWDHILSDWVLDLIVLSTKELGDSVLRLTAII